MVAEPPVIGRPNAGVSTFIVTASLLAACVCVPLVVTRFVSDQFYILVLVFPLWIIATIAILIPLPVLVVRYYIGVRGRWLFLSLLLALAPYLMLLWSLFQPKTGHQHIPL